MFSLLCPFVALVVSHFGFEGKTSVLFASVPGHCLPFYFFIKITFKWHANFMKYSEKSEIIICLDPYILTVLVIWTPYRLMSVNL